MSAELPEVLQDVRICLSAFRDAHVILPRLVGRAELRRQAFKLQWWRDGDFQCLDLSVARIGESSYHALTVEDGYVLAPGYFVLFCRCDESLSATMDRTIWILSVMRMDEPLTENLVKILQMRMNVVAERMHISKDNPFGIT